MHKNEFRMSKMNMVLNCTAGYYKSMELYIFLLIFMMFSLHVI
jgi:hypothetical protein